MTTLLVTGGSGYVGGVVVELAAGAGWTVVATSFRTPSPSPSTPASVSVSAGGGAGGVRWRRLDVRDGDAVAALCAEARPDAVVHTAYVQDGPDARPTIVDGSAHVAAAAAAAGARLVHVSTDVVFDGRLGRPYTEADPPTPCSDYGRAKAAAERAVAAAAPGAVLVRTSLVYSGPGRPPSRPERLALDPAAAHFVDEVRTPVQVDDLATALLELCTPALAHVAGPLHVAGPEAVTRVRFATLVAGREVGRATAPPGRPLDCRLDTTRARSLLRTPLRPAGRALAPAAGEPPAGG